MSKLLVIASCMVAAAIAHPALAQADQSVPAATEAPARVPVTIEAYYRIRWGSFDEFMALFEKNHMPILQAAKDAGLVTDISIDVPYNHMVGGARWDLRVSTTYRDAATATLTDSAWGAVWQAAEAKMKAANPKFAEEETRRFTLLEEHWDVVLYPSQ